MTPAKLNVFFAFFPYGGNGATSSEHPNIRSWFAKTMVQAKGDPRIGEVFAQDFSDTPITMTRNDAVLQARRAGADVLVMIDSDQHLDLYEGIEVGAQNFFASSFNFLYARKQKGLITCIGAPYCGPPPSECVYIFKWCGDESGNPNVDHRIAMYTREEGAVMKGIQECAALPTGCIMFDMELFEVTDPKHEFAALKEKYKDEFVAKALTRPFFYYEWDDYYCAKKASTEDVTVTRDMVLCCLAKLGYSPMYCNWDAWAGHYKPKCVGKPVLLTSDTVHKKYAEAVLSGRKQGHGMHMLKATTKRAEASPPAVQHNDNIQEQTQQVGFPTVINGVQVKGVES